MKFILTESQVEKFIFKYLDNQNFTIEEADNSYYFRYTTTEWSPVLIRVRKRTMMDCIIHSELIKEVESFFSIDYSEAVNSVVKYIEKTLNIKLYNITVL